MPLGLSFFTFSAISYLVDVKRKKIPARKLSDVVLYLSFFPKLTSGPIQRSKDFFEQADQRRIVGWETFSEGIQIFAFGLFKKIVLADRLSVFVNQVYATPRVFGSITVFMAVIAYSLQIYFDFSGYSDMAIGVARIIGFKLDQNFNLPYLSRNVTEFWKRWHITLSSWLQDYLYISMGGNRKGKIRTDINLILTMVIGGFWHGADWTYVAWGLMHGIGLVVHRAWVTFDRDNLKKGGSIGSVISTISTFMFVSFCWIFFRATSMTQAFSIIGRIFSFDEGVEQPYMWMFVSVSILVLAYIFAWKRGKRRDLVVGSRWNASRVNGFYPILDLTKFWHLTMFFVFCGLIIVLAYTGGSPFIYGNY